MVILRVCYNAEKNLFRCNRWCYSECYKILEKFSARTNGIRAVVIKLNHKIKPMYQMVRYHSCYIYKKIFLVGNNVVTTVIVKYLINLE